MNEMTKEDVEQWWDDKRQWTMEDFTKLGENLADQRESLDKQPGTYTTRKGRAAMGRLLDEGDLVQDALGQGWTADWKRMGVQRPDWLPNHRGSHMTQPKDRSWQGVLGVSPGIDHTGLSRAYRQAALKHHPDKNPGDPAAEERFREVRLAYEQACRELGFTQE